MNKRKKMKKMRSEYKLIQRKCLNAAAAEFADAMMAYAMENGFSERMILDTKSLYLHHPDSWAVCELRSWMLFEQADASLDAGKLEDAALKIRAMLKKHPDNSRIQADLGNVEELLAMAQESGRPGNKTVTKSANS